MSFDDVIKMHGIMGVVVTVADEQDELHLRHVKSHSSSLSDFPWESSARGNKMKRTFTFYEIIEFSESEYSCEHLG